MCHTQQKRSKHPVFGEGKKIVLFDKYNNIFNHINVFIHFRNRYNLFKRCPDYVEFNFTYCLKLT